MRVFYVNNGPTPRATVAQRISDYLVQADNIVLACYVLTGSVLLVTALACLVAYSFGRSL